MASTAANGNKFEFVIVAGARARQLLSGCTPKLGGSDKIDKPVRLAQMEVRGGRVAKVTPGSAD